MDDFIILTEALERKKSSIKVELDKSLKWPQVFIFWIPHCDNAPFKVKVLHSKPYLKRVSAKYLESVKSKSINTSEYMWFSL